MDNQNKRLNRRDYSQIYARMRRQGPPPSVVKRSSDLVLKTKPTLKKLNLQKTASRTEKRENNRAEYTPRPIHRATRGLVLLPLVGVLAFLLWPSSSKPQSQPNNDRVQTAKAAAAPTAQQLLAEQRVNAKNNNYNYDAQQKRATYTSVLDGTELFINEQTEPSSVKVDEAFVKNAADVRGIAAELDTDKGKAFITGAAQNVTLFGTGHILVTIYLLGAVSHPDLVNYINSFSPKSAQ